MALLNPQAIEKLPAMVALKQHFRTMLPPHFGKIYTSISPSPLAESVLRANCSHDGCGTRAVIHIKREKTGWAFVEDTPSFSRIRNNACEDCLQLK